jgi:hypothetical protein
MDTLDAAAFCADHTEWQAAIRSAIDEIVRLRRWKTDATYVLDAWQEAWESAGISGSLGATKSEAMLDEITRLRAEVARKADYAERMDALAEERLIECNRLRAVLDAIAALPSPLHDHDSQSLVEAVEDCWGNSDDIAGAGWKIGYAAALVDVWRILHPSPAPCETCGGVGIALVYITDAPPMQEAWRSCPSCGGEK